MSDRLFEPPLARAGATAKTATKALLDIWPTAKALAYVGDDCAWGLKERFGRNQAWSGRTHRDVAIEESVNYVEQVFNDYRSYGGLDHLDGAAAEVGPGDNAGVALLLQAAGCQTVDLVDRFRSPRSRDQQRRIYQALAARHGVPHSRRTPRRDAEHPPAITWPIGSSAEAYFARSERARSPGYDLIVSRATLEPLYDPLETISSTPPCLP